MIRAMKFAAVLGVAGWEWARWRAWQTAGAQESCDINNRCGGT